MKRLALVFTMLAVVPSLRAQTPAAPPAGTLATVDVDPLRCWWRTSVGGVRIGEAFELSLTCAALENDAVQVVPDQSHLDPTVAVLTPFEVLGGSHPEDLHAGQRRFFQYHYRLRIISPDAIGQDVRLPDIGIHYKVNSRIAANMALQGRDLVYFLPPQSIRVASLVPTDATDIRDQAGEDFAVVDALHLRAGTLEIAAVATTTLGLLVALAVGAGVARRVVRRPASSEDRELSLRAVAGAAVSELRAVQRARETEGWTDALTGRAVAALRVTAAAALDRPIGQRIVRARALAGAGSLKVATPLRRKARVVWSAVTTSDLDRDLNNVETHGRDTDRVQTIEALRDALAAFSSRQYGRTEQRDDQALDAALGRALDAAGRVSSDHAWPRHLVRSLWPRDAAGGEGEV